MGVGASAGVETSGAVAAVKSVLHDIRQLARTKGGLLAAILCFLPVGTGAAQGVLTQAKVAEYWRAGDHEVALMQGVLAGVVTAAGCFVGGWLADRFKPRPAYAGIGIGLSLGASRFGGERLLRLTGGAMSLAGAALLFGML